MIHGGMGREERMKAQEAFRHDPEVQVLLATDAAGEGINLQRAHLMVNYDLPWNPNRIEQRFGRIHRIGQTEVCHLWNLVAEETREGDVYRTLLEKLEQARTALGGQVFDVLGKLQFEGRPLRELLIEAIRYGEQPEVRARLTKVVEQRLRPGRSCETCSKSAPWPTTPWTRAACTASARTWSAPRRAGSSRTTSSRSSSRPSSASAARCKQREPRRYEVTHVPAPVRNRDRLIGIGEPVLPRYERIAFEKALVAPQGQPLAAFVCPGHPLLDATIDLTLERHRDLLRRGAVLVDERDPGTEPARALLSRARHPGRQPHRSPASGASSPSGCCSSRSTPTVHARHLHYAPYLDYRPLADGEPASSDPRSTRVRLDRPRPGAARRRRTRSPRRARAPRRGARTASSS